MSSTPENLVKKYIDKLLKEHEYVEVPGRKEKYKILWWYKPQANIYGRAGIPDYVGCLNGRMFGVEAKAEGNKPTMAQHNTMGQMEAAGARVFIVTGSSLGSVGMVDSGYISLQQWLHEETAAFKARVAMGLSGNNTCPPNEFAAYDRFARILDT